MKPEVVLTPPSRARSVVVVVVVVVVVTVPGTYIDRAAGDVRKCVWGLNRTDCD
jgi:hypothetical protein